MPLAQFVREKTNPLWAFLPQKKKHTWVYLHTKQRRSDTTNLKKENCIEKTSITSPHNFKHFMYMVYSLQYVR